MTDARGLRVDADAYFSNYLRRNTDGDARVIVEVSLLSADDAAGEPQMAPVR